MSALLLVAVAYVVISGIVYRLIDFYFDFSALLRLRKLHKED